MGTLVVGIGLLAIITVVIISIVKDKKAGKSIQCGNDCKHCGGHCH